MTRPMIVVFGLIFSLVGEAFGMTLTGRVTEVGDGDGIWVTDARGVCTNIRLERIDAPEMDQPYGRDSKALLSKLVSGKHVEVTYTECDQYDRVLGIVYVQAQGKKIEVNLEMVARGAAWHYSYYDHTPAYAAAEVAARKAKKGLWASANPINPYRWRKARRDAENVGQEAGQPLSDAPASTAVTPRSAPLPEPEPTGELLPPSCRKEYFAGRNPVVRDRPACPVNAEFPDTGYWLSVNSNKRHGRSCENYRKTRGYPCGPDEGTPCGRCKGR